MNDETSVRTSGERRFSSWQVTVIVVAACVAIAPGVAAAGSALTRASITDAHTKVTAQVSRNGRLGVAGAVAAAPAIPANEWSAHAVLTNEQDPKTSTALVEQAPATESIAISSFSVYAPGTDVVLERLHAYSGGCAPSAPVVGYRPSDLVYNVTSSGSDGTVETTFPTPLVVGDSVKRGFTCLYAVGFTNSGPVDFYANGLVGDPVQPFSDR